MKRLVLSAAIVGLFAASSLQAASLSVSVDGGPATSYELGSVAIDAAGNVTVKAISSGDGAVTGYTLTVSGSNGTYTFSPTKPSSGGYAPGTTVKVTASPKSGYSFSTWSGCDSASSNVCTVTMNANRSVSASFTATSSGGDGSGDGGSAGSCVSSSTLVCVDTKLPLSPFARVGYRPDATTVYAFKLASPATGSYTGSASATVQTGSMAAKLLVISQTPGDTSTTGKDAACVVQGTESSRINFTTNNPNANPYIYCRLAAGKTYYINASSKSKYSSGLTCNSTSSCAFYFEGR